MIINNIFYISFNLKKNYDNFNYFFGVYLNDVHSPMQYLKDNNLHELLQLFGMELNNRVISFLNYEKKQINFLRINKIKSLDDIR